MSDANDQTPAFVTLLPRDGWMDGGISVRLAPGQPTIGQSGRVAAALLTRRDASSTHL